MNARTVWALVGIVILAVLAKLVTWPDNGPAVGDSQAYAQQLAEAEGAQQDLIDAQRLSGAFRAAAKILRPSVVQINAMVKQRPMRRMQEFHQFRSPFGNDLFDELFRELEGRQRAPRELEPDQDEEEPDDSSRPNVQAGVGSGVIVSEDGYVLTNNHVVEQADELQVELSDGQVFKASVVGKDPSSDLAVLKIEATGLAAARLGDSAAMEVGDWVIAIGSPFGLEQTVTAGIISATNRRTGIIRGGFEDFLQTDAAINPGNSGGPLVNLKGEVIGINTAINSRTGTNAGVGFAIPTNMAVQIMNDLQSTGKVVRGFIGAGLDDVTNELSKKLKLPNGVLRGALIRRVLAGGPADRGGLKENDVVVGLGSRTISSSSQLMNEIAQVRPGSTIDLRVYRDGSAKDIRIVVEERTDERLSQLSDRTEIEKWGLVLDTLSPAIAQELELPESIQGAVILEIERNKPAARLRLQRYDVIRSIDDRPITNASEAKEAFEKVGKQIKLLIQRGPVEMAIATQIP